MEERDLEVRKRDDRDRRRIKEKTGKEIDPKKINSRERQKQRLRGEMGLSLGVTGIGKTENTDVGIIGGELGRDERKERKREKVERKE